ncbi:MAG TPA: lipopolysaccharide biosynthesis protein [Propioniciclava tarda]|nr:lipopolysaccharide biosynthesis protein [Propioniciclava tarda]
MKFRPVVLNQPAATSPARKGIFSIISIGLQGGSRFASNWLISQLASKVVLGVVATASALALLLNTFWPASAQSAASKFIARARGKGDDAEVQAVARHLAVRVLQVVGVLAVVAPLLWWWQYRRDPWEGLCVSAMLITLGTSQFARGVHFGAGQIARGTKVDLVTSVIGLGGTLAMLLAGIHSILLTVPLTAAMGVYSLACWPWSASGRPEKALRSEIDKFVTIAALGSIASAGLLQMTQLIAQGISEVAAGEYAPALQLVTPLAIVAGALTLVMFPSMAEAQGAGSMDRLRQITDLATRAFVAVLVPIFGAMAVASRPVMHVVYRGNYPESALIMPAFCVALLLQNVASPAVSSLTSGPHKNMWYSLAMSWAGLAGAAISWWPLVPRFGILGIAIGYAIGSGITACSLFAVAWRINGQAWSSLSVRLALSVIVIVALSWWRQSQPVDFAGDAVAGLAFLLVSSALGWPTVRNMTALRRP